MVDPIIVVAIVIIATVVGLIMRRSQSNSKQREASSTPTRKLPTQSRVGAIASNVEDPLQKIREQISGSLDMEQFRTSDGRIDAPRLLEYIGHLTSEEHTKQLGMRSIRVEDADLRGVNLSGGRFAYLDFPRALLQEADLASCVFFICHFVQADFTKATLLGATFYKTELLDARFCNIRASRVQLSHSDLRQSDFSDAFMMDATLIECQLENANFSRARLGGAVIAGECKRVNFQDADLDGSDLSNTRLIECKFEGAEYNLRTKWPTDFDPKSAGCISEQDAKLREQQEQQHREQERQKCSQKAEELRQQGYKVPLPKDIGKRILDITKLMIEEPSNRIFDSKGNLSQTLTAKSPLEQSYWIAADAVVDDLALEQAVGSFLGPNWQETLVEQIYSIEQKEVNAVLISQGQLSTNTASNHDTQQDTVSLIERLAHLRDQGIISEEEFQKKKTELLNRI